MKSFVVIAAILALFGGGVGLIKNHREKIQARMIAPATTGIPTPIGSASYAAGTSNKSIVTTDGRTRTYVLHVPAGFSSGASYPLVLLFHGGLGTGEKILGQTNFVAKSDKEKFILVAPDGIGNNWADGRGMTTAEKEGVDDVAFVRQLITKLESTLPVDAKRIYATGVSNGGMMSERLGCELSNIFAAIGPDVGPIPSNIYPTCKPSHIAVVGIQGGADPLVPVGGGEVKSSKILDVGAGGFVESAANTMKLWAGVDDCNPTPAIMHLPPTVSDGTSVDTYTYSGCTAGTDVVYYIVQGMGHGWPPNPPQAPRISGNTSQNINATDVIWAFFAAHPKP